MTTPLSSVAITRRLHEIDRELAVARKRRGDSLALGLPYDATGIGAMESEREALHDARAARARLDEEAHARSEIDRTAELAAAIKEGVEAFLEWIAFYESAVREVDKAKYQIELARQGIEENYRSIPLVREQLQRGLMAAENIPFIQQNVWDRVQRFIPGADWRECERQEVAGFIDLIDKIAAKAAMEEAA